MPSRLQRLPHISGSSISKPALAQVRRALRRARRRAAVLQQRFDSVFVHSPDAVFTLDSSGRITSANAACEAISGYAADELIGQPMSVLLMPAEAERPGQYSERLLAGESVEYEVACRHKSGRRFDLHVSMIPLIIDGDVVGVYGIGKDITVRKRLLELTRPINATSTVNEQVTLILNSLRDVLAYDSGGLYWIDRNANVLRPAAHMWAGWVSSDLDTFEIPLDKGVMGAVARANRGELVNDAHLDPRTVYPAGATVECEHLAVAPVSVDGRAVGVFYVARRSDPPFSPREFDLLEVFIGHAATAIEKTYLFEQSRASEERFQYLAEHDFLTGLPNRVVLRDRVEQAIAVARRAGQSVSLLMLDLDRFKEVNDTLGHHAGDRLLQEASARLRASVRSSDTVARLGGDEFAVVLPTADLQAAEHMAATLLSALQRPLFLDGCELSPEASIGIAACPAHGDDADTLLRRADIAMYAAKRAQGGFVTYALEHDAHSAQRLALVAELRRAIVHDELTLHYQPQVDCVTGELRGLEALVRWWHPDRGLLAPDQFVPLAERSGLITQLTRWVLANAIAQQDSWRGFAGDLSIAVNLSSRDLLDESLPAFVGKQLQRWRVSPERLVLELTESSLLGDSRQALDVLQRLRRMGVRVALDDFGTGYSSLSYLREWPIDELKVDRSFVRTMVDSGRDRLIVRALVDLAHTLELDVVAEGVEDEQILSLLREFGCDRVQGYHIARPMPPVDTARWCKGRGARLSPNLLAA